MTEKTIGRIVRSLSGFYEVQKEKAVIKNKTNKKKKVLEAFLKEEK